MIKSKLFCFILYVFAFNIVQAQPKYYIARYAGKELGYEFSNFKEGGYQLVHLGYFNLFRKDAEDYRMKKFAAIGPAGNILISFKDKVTYIGGRLSAMFAFHYFNSRNSGDFPLTVDLSYSYLNKKDNRINISVGTASVFVKATIGVNYLLYSEDINSRFYPELGFKFQITSYHQALW